MQARLRTHSWTQALRGGGAAAWPALTLGAGQGSRLLLPLLSGEHHSSQDAGGRSSPHSGSLEAPLMP